MGTTSLNSFAEIDPYMQEFFNLYCSVTPGYTIKLKTLFNKYQQFVIDRGSIPVTYKNFRKAFVELDSTLKISKFNTAYIIQNCQFKGDPSI